MKKITITENDANQRIDKFLKKYLNLPESLIYKFLRKKRIKIGGKKPKIDYKTKIGDIIELYINDELFLEEKSKKDLTPSLDIVYEDKNIIIVNKKPGMLVHDGNTKGEITLIDHIKAYLNTASLSFEPALCHRLDRNTSGLVIAAKTATALRIMNEKFKNREIRKFYYCRVYKIPEIKEAILKSYMLKNDDKVFVYDKPMPGAKTAITKYKVIKEENNTAILEIELITGRTHQIRAQLSKIGFPLIGDSKYGINKINKAFKKRHQELVAYKIIFDFKTEDELSYLKDKVIKLPIEN